MHGQFDMVEAAVRPRRAVPGQAILDPLAVGVETGLEVRLPDQGGVVADGVVKVLCDRRRVDGEGHAVGGDTVGAHVLPGDHRGARRRAHRVLVVGTAVDDAVGGQGVHDRCAGDGVAGASEGVVALLVGGDEEDLAAHSGPIGSRGTGGGSAVGEQRLVRDRY